MLLMMILLLNVATGCWPSTKTKNATQPSVNDDGLESVRVLIVGGGASGIAAASRLVEEGMTDFLVVEGGNELGGRVASKEFGEGRVELGAAFIHGEEDNVVYELAKKWGMLQEQHSENDGNVEAIYDDGQAMDINLVAAFASMCEEIYVKSYWDYNTMHASLGEYFEDEFEKKLETAMMNETMKQQGRNYLEYFGKFLAVGAASGSWYQLGVGTDTSESLPGNQFGSFKKEHSYTNFLLKLGSGIDMENQVRFNEKVLTITEGEGAVVVETDKSNYTCQYVVITVSLGVLKQDDITFLPPLPAAKKAVIDSLGFGTIGKVFLQYPHPWAQIVNSSFYRYDLLRRNGTNWTDDPASPWEEGVFQMTTDGKNPSVVTLWTNGHSARKASLLPQGQLLQEAHTLLKKFFSSSLPDLPSPISAISTSWFSNPLTRGAYSFNSVSFSSGDREVLGEPAGRKFFAGEATSDVHYSTVHGAIETGWREAHRILAIST